MRLNYGALLTYFTDIKYRFTAKDVRNQDKFIQGYGRFNKWVLVLQCAIFQICIGAFYKWPSLGPSIETHFAHSKGSLAPVFYLSCALFGFTSFIAGPWLERVGPIRPSIVGTTIYLFGHLICALAMHIESTAMLYLGYGGFIGVGTGLCFVPPIALLQKFLKNKGIASAVGIGMFGVGAVLGVVLHDYGLSNKNPTVWFLVPGVIYTVAMYFTALTFKFPIVETKERESFFDALFSIPYLLIYSLLILGIAPGLLYLPKIKTFGGLASSDTELVELLPLMVAICNAVGRVVIAGLSGWFGPIFMMGLTLLLILISLIAISLTIETGNFYIFAVLSNLVVALYGGVLGLIPGILTKIFGAGKVGALYSASVTGWSLGALLMLCVSSVVNVDPINGHQTLSTINYVLAALVGVSIALTVCLWIIIRRRKNKSSV